MVEISNRQSGCRTRKKNLQIVSFVDLQNAIDCINLIFHRLVRSGIELSDRLKMDTPRTKNLRINRFPERIASR
jgi:hypothetical protein